MDFDPGCWSWWNSLLWHLDLHFQLQKLHTWPMECCALAAPHAWRLLCSSRALKSIHKCTQHFQNIFCSTCDLQYLFSFSYPNNINRFINYIIDYLFVYRLFSHQLINMNNTHLPIWMDPSIAVSPTLHSCWLSFRFWPRCSSVQFSSRGKHSRKSGLRWSEKTMGKLCCNIVMVTSWLFWSVGG